MEKKVKKIRLTDSQKRIVLKIYKLGKENYESDETIKIRIKSAVTKFLPDCTAEEIDTIYEDCELYAILTNLPPYSKKEKSQTIRIDLSKEDLFRMARNFILQQYRNMGIEELEKQGITEKIVNRFIQENSKTGNYEMFNDMLTFLQTKSMDKDEAEELKKNDATRFRKFVEMYIKYLLDRELNEVPREQLIQEMEEYKEELPEEKRTAVQEKFNSRLEILNMRKRILVSNNEVIDFIQSGKFKTNLAEEQIYNIDGTRKVENSLVEDKLLTVYLLCDRSDEFKKRAEQLIYDEDTGTINREQKRTISKYITYLSQKMGDRDTAINFITDNMDLFKTDLVILGQLYNMYKNMLPEGVQKSLRINQGDEKTSEAISGILGVIKTITDNVKETNRGYSMEEAELGIGDSRSIYFLRELNKQLENMLKQQPSNKKLKKYREKLAVIIKKIELSKSMSKVDE